MILNKKFWKPSLTSQFAICPIPFHLDTYRGCVYNCNYCFARDFVTFSRRNNDMVFTDLVANRSELFTAWMNRTLKKNDYDYTRGEEVALQERIPLKLGATADPFPPIEISAKVTHSFLGILDYFDYPVEIQTKNPSILATYAQEFLNPNWTIAVTIITTNEEFRKACEPSAPSIENRLESIKNLVNQGRSVMVKIQPSIYPQIIEDLPNLVRTIKESGCWAFNIEGLKIRKTMTKDEQLIFQRIGHYLGLDIRDYYRSNGKSTGSDWELKKELKLEYIRIAQQLANEYNIKFFVADNDIGPIGDGAECCGTQALRDYKIWGNNRRSKFFVPVSYESEELGKCLVNFTRSKNNVDNTLNDISNCTRF